MNKFNKNLLLAPALACAMLLAAAFCAAQGIDLSQNIQRSPFNFARDNYVTPEDAPADAAPAQTANAPQDAPGEETDPNPGPWMICDIAATGLRNINKKTITKNISAREGTFYHASSVQDDVTALMALGNFDGADLHISPIPGARKDKEDKTDATLHPCNHLTVVLAEKPLFDKITYIGRKKLSKSAIQTAMALKLKDPFNQARLAGDMDRIAAAYAQKGYTNAIATFTTELDEAKNTVAAIITLQEGSRTRVGEVTLDGISEIPQKKLLKKMANRPGKIYKTQKLPEDNYKTTLYARNEGYYDFKIDDFTQEFNEDKSLVNLTYKITEGAPAVFGEATFSGNTVYSEEELNELVFFKEGKKFNQQKFDITMRDLQEKYADKGYLRAEINPQRSLDGKNLNIHFDITENNLVFVDHIDITGNESTKTYVFARELTFKEGEVFNYSKIRRSQAKIMNLGFINDAQIDITPGSDINKVDVGYNIAEGRPGMFTAGVAMSSLDGLYGDVSINHLNLFGKAQRLSVRTLFGKKILDYTLTWYTPWIYEKPISLGVDVFDTRRYRSYMGSSSAYTQEQVGGRVRIGPRFNDDIYNLGFSYSFENNNIYDISEAFQSPEHIQHGLVEGKTNISTLGASFAIDTRDNYWDPTEGARNMLGLDVSGGPIMGDLDSYQVNFKSSYNKTLINIGKDYPIVLMIANRFGVIKPYGRTDVLPTWQRMFLGGADTVRGYDNTGEIGPEYGGEIYYIGNVELKFPLAREGRRTIAQFAAFFDIGNSWMEWDDIRFKTGEASDEFKMGFGFGLRFVTPSMPIRLDWGYGLNHKTGERRSQIYFSMANLF